MGALYFSAPAVPRRLAFQLGDGDQALGGALPDLQARVAAVARSAGLSPLFF